MTRNSWRRRHLVLEHQGKRPIPSPEEVQATAEYMREMEAAYADASRRYHSWQKVKWAHKTHYYQQLDQQQQQQLEHAVATESETSSCSSGSHQEEESPRVARRKPRHNTNNNTRQPHHTNGRYNRHPYPNNPNYHTATAAANVCPQHRFRGTPEETRARYVAMDCEMVGIGPQGQHSVLARVTILDWYGTVLMDEYVQPPRRATVTDYRTFVSGITADMLSSGAAISHEACQERVRHLLHGKVLVGHALKNDLRVLGISHPWYMTRDTAKYEPFMKMRSTAYEASSPPPSPTKGDDDSYVHLWPRSLKELAIDKLQREIQQPGQPHCPREDALAALDLYKLVSLSWENSMEYKVTKSKEIMRQQLLDHQQSYAANTSANHSKNGGSVSPTPQQQQPNNNHWTPSPQQQYKPRRRPRKGASKQPYGGQQHQQYYQYGTPQYQHYYAPSQQHQQFWGQQQFQTVM